MASGVWKAWSGISGLSVCVYVMKGVSVITWPTAHGTEKHTQAACTLRHSRRNRIKVVCLYNMSVVKCQCVSYSVRECFW